jgi:hypothetical protein
MSLDPWDDDRLSAAFAERARSNPTPPTLTTEALEAVRAGQRLRTTTAWRPWMAIAAVVVVVVAVGIGLNVPHASGPGPRPSAGAPDTAPPVAVTFSPSPAASSALDLPVLSIVEAIGIRDSGHGDREIKVAGWIPPMGVRYCPLIRSSPPPPTLLEPGCGPMDDLLYEDATTTSAPTIPLYLGGVDTAWRSIPANEGATRTSLVLVGHFHDRRALACTERADCEAQFVVDQVSVGGSPVPITTERDRDLPLDQNVRWAPADIEAALAPQGSVLSMVLMPLSSLATVEPMVAPWASDPPDRLAWRVQVLAGDHATTYLINDATDAALNIASDGSSSPVELASVPAGPAEGVFGLPILSVAEAATIRDGGADDQEIAVRGWLASVAVPCPSEPNGPTPPFGLSCANSFAWLSSTSDRPDTNGPTGPSIRPVFQFADIIGAAPQEAVLIGHFDDRRATSCPADAQASCRDWFIVDRTGTSEDSYLTTYLTDAVLRSNAIGVESAISAESPDGRILSMVVLPAGGIGAVEPSIGDRRGGLTFDGIVWRAQVLEEGHATTYLFPDGGDALYEMNPDGEPVLVTSAEPTDPPPSPAWSPALVDGRLAVIGSAGFDGSLTCNPGDFPFAGLSAPAGAEHLAGPEYEALRIALASPAFGDLIPSSDTPTWRVASRSDTSVVFLATKPKSTDGPGWVALIADRLDRGWVIQNGGDCQPLPVIPGGYRPATWALDPAYAKPTATTRTLHLLVTENACSSGQSADDRLSPAFVVADVGQVVVTIDVLHQAEAQDCPGNPPSTVTLRLPAPLGDRSLVDGNVNQNGGSGG